MTERIYLKASRSEGVAMIRDFVAAITGAPNRFSYAAESVMTAIGFAALGDIHQDFVRKARGGVGEDGVRWPPLSPKTLAYSRRFGSGEKSRLKKAAGLGRANNQRGLLTAQQNKRWKRVYGQSLARFAASMDIGSAKARAAQVAWATLKKEGARTKLEVFGNRPHEILRDTGVLLNSLSPGQVGNSAANLTPAGSSPDGQIFELQPQKVIVGTNVPYASKHQNGDAKRGIPARPFIPRQVPQVWLERWVKAGARSMRAALSTALSGAA
jgi:hypothetical protein